MEYDWNGKRVAVIGLARSGLACAEVLSRRGAQVRLYDSKPAGELEDGLARARALGVAASVGGAPVEYGELDVLVTSPGVPRRSPILQQAVHAGVPVWSEIEAAYQIARAPILAVTGTNGKTTTVALLGEMLRTAGIETYVAGNIAAGEIALPLILAADQAGPDSAIVAEISSFQLEWISGFRPKVAALLNITPDHGDRQDWDEYVASKWRIFENQGDGDTAVLSGALFGERLRRKLPQRVVEFGVAEKEEPMVFVGAGKIPICRSSEVRLPGRHNLENIAAAAEMAAAFGVGPEPVRAAATHFAGVVHRLEYVGTVGGVRYVNNSMCTNVAAFERSLEALPEPKVVIAGGVFKGGDLAPVAEAVRRCGVKALVLIGRSAPDIEAAVRRAGCDAVRRAETLPDAVELARDLAAPGETVLLAPACASFDMFRDFEDRGDRFKQAVRALGEPE